MCRLAVVEVPEAGRQVQILCLLDMYVAAIRDAVFFIAK